MENSEKEADKQDVEFPVNGCSMQVEIVILSVWAGAASAIAAWLWRGKTTLAARLGGLRDHCQKLDSENQGLIRSLSAHENREKSRIGRLEHDLKSPLGVVIGFSTLIREYLEIHVQQPPPLLLDGINGIDQAAKKMVEIVESAADDESRGLCGEKAAVEEPAWP